MSESNTEFLSLDAIQPKRLKVVIDEIKHEMKPLSVLDFVKNMKALKSLAENDDLEKEVEIVHEMLARSFPTVPFERIQAMTMEEIHFLQNALQTVTNTAREKEAEAVAAANPPTAAPEAPASVGSTSDISSAA